jgi:hypothetical protein
MLFSVPTVPDQPRAIYLWVSNTPRSSYFSLSVESHTFFRLNYPLRLNRWYHSCTSWNGRTGEWQIWVNAERVGRGFHNRVRIHIADNTQIPTSGSRLQIWLPPVTVLMTQPLFLFTKGPRSRCYGRTAALRAYCATLWWRWTFFCFST